MSAGSVKKMTNVIQPSQNERGSCWLTRQISRQIDAGSGCGVAPAVIGAPLSCSS